MFDEDLESIKQLCTFLLNNSKVKRKGGVCELDLSPIKIASLASIFSGELLGGLLVTLDYFKFIGIGKGVVGIAFNSLRKIFCCCFNFLSSWREIFPLIFFISPTILYSMVS